MTFSNDFRHSNSNETFGLRASALIIKDNKIFLTKDNNNHYYTIGGASLVGEDTRETVSRETFEEVGIEVKVGDLAFIVENQFKISDHFYHNIEFHYFVTPLSDSKLKMNENGIEQSCEWVSLNQIANINLVPEFLKTELIKWSGYIIHIVNK